MKIKFITILGLFFLFGCSKSSIELFELSKEKLKNNQPELALKDLEKLLEKYPNKNDTVASFLLKNPSERFIIRRIQNNARYTYSEIKDN